MLLMHVNSRAVAELHAPLSDIFPPLETHWLPGKVIVDVFQCLRIRLSIIVRRTKSSFVLCILASILRIAIYCVQLLRYSFASVDFQAPVRSKKCFFMFVVSRPWVFRIMPVFMFVILCIQLCM